MNNMNNDFVYLLATVTEDCMVDRFTSRIENCIFRHTRRNIFRTVLGSFVNVLQDAEYQNIYSLLVDTNFNEIDNVQVLNVHEMIRYFVLRSRVYNRILQILSLACEQCESIVPYP
jgi:hypothetical protein